MFRLCRKNRIRRKYARTYVRVTLSCRNPISYNAPPQIGRFEDYSGGTDQYYYNLDAWGTKALGTPTSEKKGWINLLKMGKPVTSNPGKRVRHWTRFFTLGPTVSFRELPGSTVDWLDLVVMAPIGMDHHTLCRKVFRCL